MRKVVPAIAIMVAVLVQQVAVAGDYAIDTSQELVNAYDQAMDAITKGDCRKAESIIKKVKGTEDAMKRHSESPDMPVVTKRLENIRAMVIQQIDRNRRSGQCK